MPMAHLPTNSKGLTVAETLAQDKQTQDEANYIPEATENVCGTCRFFLRPDSGAVGNCQVVEGDINWNGTSDLYISAEQEAAASLAEMNAYSEDEKERGIMNKLQKLYVDVKRLFDSSLKTRVIKDVEEWDGSASGPNFNGDTIKYCNSCLINLNEGPEEDWTQANCKLPVRRGSDTSDTFVRQAVFAAAGGNGIQAVDAPEADKEAAANILIGAYEEMDLVAPDAVFEIAGKEPPTERAISFEAIREQAWGLTMDSGWLIDVYDDDGQMYALLSVNGHLLRQQLGIVDDSVVLAGEPLEVSVDHPAIQTRTTIHRQKDGRYRWKSISATSVLNRVGQIDSKALFDSFETHSRETKEYPIRQFYHQGDKFRTGLCDFIGRDEHCLITSGLFDDTKLAKMEIKAREKEPDYWGESIGYLPTDKPEMLEIQEGINIPVYTIGILREISTLPEIQAANLFTVTVQQEEVNRMLTMQRDAFIKFFDGDEQAMDKWLAENTDGTNRAIQDDKMITRNKEDDKKPTETESETIEVDDSMIVEIVKRVASDNLFTGLQTQIEGLTTAIETINANQGDIVSRLDSLQEDANGRFEKLERSKAKDLQEAVENLPSVPQVRRYSYTPRQGNAQDNKQMATMADQADSLKNFY